MTMILSFETNAGVSENMWCSIQYLFSESYNPNKKQSVSRWLDRPSEPPVAFARITLSRLLMNHSALKFLSILLILCVLSVGGLAQAQSVEHAGHHAQHQAATHGTLLCSWMCAAGTVLDTAVVTFQAELSPIAFISLPYFVQPSIETCQTSPSRAPPSFSL